MNKDTVIKQFKETLSVISFFEIREKTLRQELEFYIDKSDYIYKFDKFSLKRLEHEIMFLSVDTYSLHQGISKKKSLYKNVIKNYGKEVTKVDKNNAWNEDNVIFLGMIDSDNKFPRELTEKEIKESLEEMNYDDIQSRKKIKEKVGIKSHIHQDIDKWIYENFHEDNDADIKNLSDYRKNFAHRLDSIERLVNELTINKPQELVKILDIVQIVLQKYKDNLHDILVYMKSIKFIEIKNIQYNSMDKIKYFIENRK
ncbi:hypothetical protein H6G11_16480 [Cyanobacterium aponinum FACHB-4101]|uniref:hypothetical protein n=1 Tax=Cyanobacterium aponinum TaxID=379064 RepID=UPI001680BEB1|nr:hypothetical protein [Cyanobacterium aponinum]MBD2395842.1 hypothetical protein [Cyanobacterium aponinum FACHB-4101]